MNHTFSIYPFRQNDFGRVDVRLRDYMDKWQLKTICEGVEISVNDDSKVDIIKYFQFIKKPGDLNYTTDEQYNKIGMTLWAWLVGFEHKVEINLFINGPDVLSGGDRVQAKFLKCSDEDMELYHNGKLITDFTEKGRFSLKPVSKVWIDDLESL